MPRPRPTPQFDEEVVGSRAQPRSVTESTVPIDAIPDTDLRQSDSNLANQHVLLPSFHVNLQEDGDMAAVVRPARLRGLAPDHTLVLANGKRRHRGAVISWLGHGVADGAQGPGISTIPALALGGIEVLRPGAAAQYGSDAIAGVLNLLLKDEPDGSLELRSGTHAAGDGRAYGVAANAGLPLGRAGFADLSLEYGEIRSTDRSVQRGGRGGPHRGRERPRRGFRGASDCQRRPQALRQPRPPVRQRRSGVRPRELRRRNVLTFFCFRNPTLAAAC